MFEALSMILTGVLDSLSLKVTRWVVAFVVAGFFLRWGVQAL